MSRPIGPFGLLGVLLLLIGLGVTATIDPLLAAALLCVLLGVGIIIVDVLRRIMASFGLGGMF